MLGGEGRIGLIYKVRTEIFYLISVMNIVFGSCFFQSNLTMGANRFIISVCFSSIGIKSCCSGMLECETGTAWRCHPGMVREGFHSCNRFAIPIVRSENCRMKEVE